jgi:membrane protease YdiL (CAAX protease family)
MQGLIIAEVTTIEGILILWSSIVGVYLFIPPMLIVGLLNLEESGYSVVASLPVFPRQQAKAKLILMFSIQGISLTFTSIILTILTGSFMVFVLLVITLPIAWSLLLVMFELKIHFFGKLKYKYILEELHKENKIAKWILMIVIELALYINLLLYSSLWIFTMGLTLTMVTLLIIGLIGLSLLIFAFTKMFPKEIKILDYVTGGYLRENINMGTIALLVLYFIWGYLFSPIMGIVSPLISDLPYTSKLFISFFLNFGIIALLWLVAVPIGLKLPKRESFRDFTKTIGLRKDRHLSRNLLLALGLIYIYFLSLIYTTLILGDVNFNHWYINNPNPNLPFPFFLGWFLFIFMLIPGIWEEMAFRGVILNLQLKKFSNATAIVLNGVIFGLFHLVNLLGGASLYGTIIQVVYASCLGIALAYLYIKTRSLIPCILIHYLVNSAGQIFNQGIFPNIFTESLYAIFGAGIFPMILILLLVKVLLKNENV